MTLGPRRQFVQGRPKRGTKRGEAVVDLPVRLTDDRARDVSQTQRPERRSKDDARRLPSGHAASSERPWTGQEVVGNYPSKGVGERGAWFRDSEGNLLGLGEPV
jgi:hypothetical protein